MALADPCSTYPVQLHNATQRRSDRHPKPHRQFQRDGNQPRRLFTYGRQEGERCNRPLPFPRVVVVLEQVHCFLGIGAVEGVGGNGVRGHC